MMMKNLLFPFGLFLLCLSFILAGCSSGLPSPDIKSLDIESPDIESPDIEPADIEQESVEQESIESESVESALPTYPPLFATWNLAEGEKPKLLLFLTGFLEGYIEPCGCAGIGQMKGGLGRRHSALQMLERKDWNVMPIDAGNLNKGFGLQEELKFNFVIDEAYRLMRYQAVGLGSREILFPTDTLYLYSVDVPGNPKLYTSANVALYDFSEDNVAPFRILEQAGLRVGVVSVLGDSLRQNLDNDDIVSENVAAKIQKVLPKLTQCDQKILIIHGSDNEVNELIEAFANQFEFIVPGNTVAEPPIQPKKAGNTMIVEVGKQGRYAIAIGLFASQEPASKEPLSNETVSHQTQRLSALYERIPLDGRFDNSPTILELMKIYQEQLRESGLEGLGIRPIPNSRRETHGGYVGTQSCSDCHDTATQIWRQSGHARAWQSLKETAIPPRNYDPECIACHVVGWNVSVLLPYQGGFLNERDTPRLVNVGCEACHGPGERHVDAEKGADRTLQTRLRAVMRLPIEEHTAQRHCITCHDGDNSPDFDFNSYWEKIKHEEENLFQ